MFNAIFRRSKKENKTLLEHKLYLAKETPESIFDVSECDISNVPGGIYSICKVFRKEILNLSKNNLQSLAGGGKLSDLNDIVVLNLNFNAFTILPSEIHFLQSLKELYLEGNQLKKLPRTICSLVHLEILNLNNNELRELPEDFGMLCALVTFFIKGNARLYALPASLHKAHHLKEIHLDSETIQYPPPEVTMEGTEAILKFLCIENGCDCYEHKDLSECDSSQPDHNVRNTYFEESSHIGAKIWDLEKMKEQKQKDFLAIEREWNDIKQQELEAAYSQRLDREKLLEDLAHQQEQFIISLDKIQQTKDEDKFRLIEQLRETEHMASQAIQQLLRFNAKPPPALFEQEMREHEELLRAANEHKEVRTAQILLEMQEIIENEANKFKLMDLSRIETTKTILEQEVESNSHIVEILQTIDNRGKELNLTLQQDDDLQKLAVAALLERSDVRCWSLVQQVMLVETQLAALTTIELDRRKLEVDQNLNDLALQRIELSHLLVELLEQQNIRRNELKCTLQDLEEINQAKAEDFWIRQYQALLDRMPEGLAALQRKLHPHFVELLLLEGVLNYLPLLAKFQQSDDDALLMINEADLKEIGIGIPQDRERILRAIQKYQKHMENKTESKAASVDCPSAPTPEEEVASAPIGSAPMGTAEAECVICMDQRCEVVYIPCGHYCSCYNCSTTITDCPMCRAVINRIIRVDSK